MLFHGADHVAAGVYGLIYGTNSSTMTAQLMQKWGMSPEAAANLDNGINLVATIGGGGLIYQGTRKAAALSNTTAIGNQAIKTIHPNNVRFSQSSISNNFRNGATIDDLSISLKNGTTRVNEMQPIRLVERNNVLYTLDNRRLEAFRRAGLQIPYRMATSEEVAAEAWKFTSRNGGVSIRIKGK